MKSARCLCVAACLWFGAAGWAASKVQAQGFTAELPDPMDFGVVYEKIAFEAADTDGNNLVSEAEFVRDAAAAFSGLDRNRDLKLTPDEFRPYDAGKFALIDINADGALSFAEVMTFKMNAFRSADKNNDTALSFDEMVDRVKTELGR